AGHGVTALFNHTHTSNVNATVEDGSGNSRTTFQVGAASSGTTGATNPVTYDNHYHTGVAKQTGMSTVSQSGAFTGLTGDENSAGHTLSGGATATEAVTATGGVTTTASADTAAG